MGRILMKSKYLTKNDYLFLHIILIGKQLTNDSITYPGTPDKCKYRL